MSNVVPVLLRDILVSHNPRSPVPALQAALADEGYEDYSALELAQKLALSEDPADKAKFVALVDKYENTGTPDSLVALADSRARKEIQPILLRAFRVLDGVDEATGKNKYIHHYGIVVGERRVLAAAYNHAKHGTKPEIGAQVREIRLEEAFDLAVDENAKRRDMTDYEYGVIFKTYRQRVNPATGKKWSLKDIGIRFGFDYQFVRGRHALAAYLSQADQQRVAKGGRVNITAAIKKALGLKRGRQDGSDVQDKKSNRQRALNLHECQQLFDSTQQRQLDAELKKAYLQALADVMQISYAVALVESNKRIDEAALAAARKVERQHRNGKNAA
jgi:hypothetical protein